uniref:Uncharacterized protein n=1 Tax=Panstrongylus lignarius TaxID=156445 RepID=A0A224XUV1_9HEMI
MAIFMEFRRNILIKTIFVRESVLALFIKKCIKDFSYVWFRIVCQNSLLFSFVFIIYLSWFRFFRIVN